MFNVYKTRFEKNFIKCVEKESIIHGCFIKKIRINKKNNLKRCQIIIEKIQLDLINIEYCKIINEKIKFIFTSFNNCFSSIQISSSGYNKPITRKKDFIKCRGKLIKIITLYQINNKYFFQAILKNVTKNKIHIFLINKMNFVLNLEIVSELFMYN